RKLLALRRELEPLRRGDTVLLQSGERTRAYARVTSDSSLIVALNNGNYPEVLKITLPPALAGQSRWFDRLSDNAETSITGVVFTLKLPSRSAAVLTPLPPKVTAER